ncbi:MAG: OadG family protein [Bacteroidales bacterium]|nr:OadG family protein [Candidatus Cacconaster merdequi]
MKKIKFILAVAGLTIALGAAAQSQDALRLNEYLVENTDDFQDDFGQQSSWMEIFNTSYGTVDMGGCFLTNDPANLTKYPIPGGDILTKIKPRQHALFWADNQPFRGTFHISFNLEESDELILVKSDGKTIIDRIKIRHDLPDNVSFGRTEDGKGSINGDGEGWNVMKQTSPSTNNLLINKQAKPAKMKEMDPYGWIMAIMSMGIVFLALTILFFIFKTIGKVNIKLANKNVEKNASAKNQSSSAVKADYKDTPAEVYAAIATAFHLYKTESEAHDEESFIITQRHTDRTYSPWSSKIYMLRETPTVKKR